MALRSLWSHCWRLRFLSLTVSLACHMTKTHLFGSLLIEPSALHSSTFSGRDFMVFVITTRSTHLLMYVTEHVYFSRCVSHVWRHLWICASLCTQKSPIKLMWIGLSTLLSICFFTCGFSQLLLTYWWNSAETFRQVCLLKMSSYNKNTIQFRSCGCWWPDIWRYVNSSNKLTGDSPGQQLNIKTVNCVWAPFIIVLSCVLSAQNSFHQFHRGCCDESRSPERMGHSSLWFPVAE